MAGIRVTVCLAAVGERLRRAEVKWYRRAAMRRARKSGATQSERSVGLRGSDDDARRAVLGLDEFDAGGFESLPNGIKIVLPGLRDSLNLFVSHNRRRSDAAVVREFLDRPIQCTTSRTNLRAC